MTGFRKITVALSEELAAALDAAVERGDYPTTGEIVREALNQWQRQRRLRDDEIAELRRLIQEGLDSGPAVEGNFDVEDIKRRGRARLAELRAAEQ